MVNLQYIYLTKESAGDIHTMTPITSDTTLQLSQNISLYEVF